MEYCLAAERMKYQSCYPVSEPRKLEAEKKKLDTTCHVLYGSLYRNRPEQIDRRDRRQTGDCQELGEESVGRDCLMGL